MLKKPMLNKLVKVMAIIGAICVLTLLIGAASITLIGNSVDISGDLIVSGNITVNGVSYAHVPSGTIVMYNGDTAPAGWAICNGTNGTPDLRNRFIVGAGSSYARGATGGEATHTLTINEMPAHTHPTDDYVYSENTGTNLGYPGSDEGMDWDNSPKGVYRHDTLSTGGGAAHENRPPYYALLYIMKL